MLDVSFDFKILKEGFFDRERTIRSLAPGERKILSKFGAFVRQRAKTSMRRRRAAAAAESPPSVHSNDPYASLRNILFAYDAGAKSVVIGPVALSGSKVPVLQEYGGPTTITRRENRGTPKKVTVQIRPHPFMNPAFDYEREHSLPDLFKNATI